VLKNTKTKINIMKILIYDENLKGKIKELKVVWEANFLHVGLFLIFLIFVHS